jgi:hypothetical protein
MPWFRDFSTWTRKLARLAAFPAIQIFAFEVAALDRLQGAGRADAFPGFGLSLILIGDVG